MVKKAQPAEETPKDNKSSQLFDDRRNLKMTSLWMPPDLLEELRVIAFEERCTKSEVARRAIAEWVADYRKK